jgi:hypothetical protein
MSIMKKRIASPGMSLLETEEEMYLIHPIHLVPSLCPSCVTVTERGRKENAAEFCICLYVLLLFINESVCMRPSSAFLCCHLV